MTRLRSTLVLALVLVAGFAVVAAPTASARQFCVDYRGSDPSCPGYVCVWDHLEDEWDCVVREP